MQVAGRLDDDELGRERPPEPVAAASAATSSAWRSASGLPRVATRSVSTSPLEVEQAAKRLGEPFAAR